MNRQFPFTSAIFLMILLPAAGAAEEIRWEDLKRRFGGNPTCTDEGGAHCQPGVIEFRSVAVFTSGGKHHRTRRLLIDTNQLRLFGHGNQPVTIPRREVRRIEIRSRWRHVHKITDAAIFPLALAGVASCGLPLGAYDCNPFIAGAALVVFVPPGLAYTAATAPFYLAADAIGYLSPAISLDIATDTSPSEHGVGSLPPYPPDGGSHVRPEHDGSG